MNSRDSAASLDDAELSELQAFFFAEDAPADRMDISSLDGFMTALVTGPPVPVEEWWPVVVGAATQADSLERHARILELALRHRGDVERWLIEQPEGFEPLLYDDPSTDPPARIANAWCEGYMRAVGLRLESWKWVEDDEEAASFAATIMSFADQAVVPEFRSVLADGKKRAQLTELLGPCAVALHAAWSKRPGAE